MFDESVPVEHRSRDWDDDGANLLTHHLVGYAHHGNFKDSRCCGEHILYFHAVHVLSPAVDHVLDPVDDVGETIVVYASQIAGVQPTADEGFSGGFRIIPEATAEAFVGGWLHTGDLARIDDDGFTYIVDRVKDMINRGGENVYCVEVENVLSAAPGVFEVAVVGVPDQMMGCLL